ncbi:MAG: hypothetical protein IKV00_04090 [Clostridia bacterium]|nr:hypothetical protein [Clostridia bacterium]
MNHQTSDNKIQPFTFSRQFSIIFLVVFFLLFLLVPTLLFLLPSKSFSENENRPLATLPALETQAVFSGDYTRRLSAYLQDHLPARSLMLRAKSIAEMSLLKRENNRVLLLENGYLVKHFSYSAQEIDTLEDNLKRIGVLCDVLSATGHPAVFLCAPRAVDVLGREAHEEPSKRSPWTAVARETPEALLVTDLLREKSRRGEAVWFHTDHHWTPLGAFYLYEILGESLGYTPYPRDSFTEETVSQSFLGTAYSACLLPATRADEIRAFRYAGDADFLCTDVRTGQTEQGFYREEALSTKDQYTYFLGQNTAHLRIVKEGASRPTLLVIKDSYAQCLVPFLARHFNVEMLDLRYMRGDATETIRAVVSAPDYAGALILCNADTLTAEVGFSLISAEKLQ